MNEIRQLPELKGKLFRLRLGVQMGSEYEELRTDGLYTSWEVNVVRIAMIPNMAIVLHLGEMAHGLWNHVICNDQAGWAWGRLCDLKEEDEDVG